MVLFVFDEIYFLAIGVDMCDIVQDVETMSWPIYMEPTSESDIGACTTFLNYKSV